MSLLVMNEERLAAAFRLLDRETKRKVTPGAVAVVSLAGRKYFHVAGRAVDTEETKIPATLGTIYDTASLTKTASTLPLILILLEQGELRLKDPVAYHLAEFGGNGKEEVTIRQLLTHTSGLRSHVNLHSHGWSAEQILAHVYEQELAAKPGERIEYSDLGYIVLGQLAASRFGMPLDAAARRYVYEPLGMSDTMFVPPVEFRGRIAATEWDDQTGAPLWGVVHDENARAMGGVCGHAGLFSTAHDLSRYADLWAGGGSVNGRRLFSEATVQAATRSWTHGLPGGRRGLGWSLKGDYWDASGDLLSERCYGHTGFTGTSLYIDPDRELSVVLLTNRVHYGRGVSVVRLRDCFHNAVAACLEQQ
ncbi:serine hydrolase domain-containing protein [Paenibacillus silviterrae]|uniref:serine hydrolase domain-containing protein n=1 Tax=Paenibacillus silviterrae TaxID=3242194 RepID=UPI002542EBB3|nr:serine hydrolase domain-containing protein [Paenibacillus chinjuensis]